MFAKKLLSVVCFGILSMTASIHAASAGTWETAKVNEIRTVVNQNTVSFTLGSERIHNGCSGDDSFFFDASTSSGKILWATLLSAKASGKNVNIYISSAKSSSTQGCVNFQWWTTVLDIAP